MTACSALMTSMMTPPFSISARPVFKRKLVELPLFCDMKLLLLINLNQRPGLAPDWTCHKVHLRYSVQYHCSVGRLAVGRWSLAKVKTTDIQEPRGQRPNQAKDQRPRTALAQTGHIVALEPLAAPLAGTPLYRWFYDELRSAILEGRIAPGARSAGHARPGP